ncbi:glycosyltransferase family 2 protein [Pseudodonghicola flavimaris]|uniref:Glycosyltransferase family 2 protein n=1 Tax=Pseudodonghicola flavimaris TaxID=3050036 RepID=A0ABT7EV98_9RHOB|nr:glycosyltransferase family 2 protein [Pseudodonghicola flavimaris]MDK3016214.1 glycosyltransferase family 2 protein [Pseudodonghicola flavimaris]
MEPKRSEAGIKWGIVSTIKADEREILEFAAYHLELGAHRLYIHLDDPEQETFDRLKAHPKIRVFACDEAYWRKRGKRPVKHQARQTANATRLYRRARDVDWLIHIDVDEFLWPGPPLADQLAALPADILCARVRPIEALAGPEPLFKGFIPAGPEREATVERLYPRFGAFVKGGFLSHLAGKLFVRTGLGPTTLKIHNVFVGDQMNPGETELRDTLLCHNHAKNWDEWIASFQYRLSQGSYRAELAPSRPREHGGLTLHEVLSTIHDSEGDAGLRAFYDELCADTPSLRGALEREGLLHRCELDLTAKYRKQFHG